MEQREAWTEQRCARVQHPVVSRGEKGGEEEGGEFGLPCWLLFKWSVRQ